MKLFNLLFILLGDHDTPTSSNLVTRIQDAVLPTDLRFAANEFLSAGGRIEWALACIMDTCEDPDNNVFDKEALHELPRCKNDEAYMLVRSRIGLDPDVMWGPYSP